MTRLSRFYMLSETLEIAVVECFFFGLFAKNQSTFLRFSFVTIILEIIFTTHTHKKTQLTVLEH